MPDREFAVVVTLRVRDPYTIPRVLIQYLTGVLKGTRVHVTNIAVKELEYVSSTS